MRIDKAGNKAIVQTGRTPHPTRPGCERLQADIRWDGGTVTHYPPEPKVLTGGMPEPERERSEQLLHEQVCREVTDGRFEPQEG